MDWTTVNHALLPLPPFSLSLTHTLSLSLLIIHFWKRRSVTHKSLSLLKKLERVSLSTSHERSRRGLYGVAVSFSGAGEGPDLSDSPPARAVRARPPPNPEVDLHRPDPNPNPAQAEAPRAGAAEPARRLRRHRRGLPDLH